MLRVYERLGLRAEYRPVNDIVVKNKKISGQGAGDIGRYLVFVGNILLCFNTGLMSQLFKLSHHGMREWVRQALEENITWLEREGVHVSSQEVQELLVEEFSRSFEFEGVSPIPELALELADKLKEELTLEEFLLEDTGKRHKFIKIREEVFVKGVELGGKPAGLLIEGNVIKKVLGLPMELCGLAYERETLLKVVGPELANLLIE